MKIKVLEPQRVIWSSETRETVVDVDGVKLTVRQFEDDNHGEIYIKIGDGRLMEDYEMEDSELKKIGQEIAYNIRNGMFDNEGDEFDSNELVDDELD